MCLLHGVAFMNLGYFNMPLAGARNLIISSLVLPPFFFFLLLFDKITSSFYCCLATVHFFFLSASPCCCGAVLRFCLLFPFLPCFLFLDFGLWLLYFRFLGVSSNENDMHLGA